MGNACCADEAKRGDTNDFRVAGNAKLEDGGRTRKKAAMNGFGMEDQYGTEGGESNYNNGNHFFNSFRRNEKQT